MAINLGEQKLLKEANIEVNENYEVSGYLGLIDGRKINLSGKLSYLNDYEFNERNRPNLPLIIHYRLRNPLNKTDNILIHKYKVEQPLKIEKIQDCIEDRFETSEEYLSQFVGDQVMHKLRITIDLGALSLTAYSKPYGKWRAGHPDPKEYEIIEAKNVPGLKDVKRGN